MARISSFLKFAILMTQISARRKVMLKKHTIITHPHPHLDERYAIVLLREVNPTLQVEFWSNRNETPDGRSPAEWESEGYILLGVAGSQLDEHQTGQQERKNGSAISLTCDYLGNHKAEIQELVEHIVAVDTKAKADPFSLHFVINLMGMGLVEDLEETSIQLWTKLGCQTFVQMKKDERLDLSNRDAVKAFKREQREAANRIWKAALAEWFEGKKEEDATPKDEEMLSLNKFSKNLENGTLAPFTLPLFGLAMSRAYDLEVAKAWLALGIEAKYQEQKQFCDALAEFKTNAKITEYRGIRIAAITSENPVVSRAARSEQGGNTAICIIRRNSGNVAIMSNGRFGIKLDLVVVELRTREMAARGIEISKDDPPLDSESFKGIWHYLLGTQGILNGSHSCQNDPTSLSLDEITEVVMNYFRR